MKTRFIFFRLLSFKGTCFKFYLIAVLICYYNTSQSDTVTVSFLVKFIAGGLELGEKRGLGCSKNIMLSAMVFWGVFSFEVVLYY